MSILANAINYQATFGIEADFGFEAWHPTVIDFLSQYGLEQWPRTGAGYRYWGAITTDQPENPFVFVSNDGTTWAPAPIHASQSAPPNAHQLDTQYNFDEDLNHYVSNAADVDIVYDSGVDQIVCTWLREGTAAGGTGLTRATISKTLLLSTPVLVVPSDLEDINMISMSIVPLSPSLWHAYMTDWTGENIVFRTTTDKGLTWSTPQTCTVNAIQSAYSGAKPWHIAARRSPFEPDKVDLVITAWPVLSRGSFQGLFLVHAQTTISDPTTITTPLAPTKLLESPRDYTYWGTHFSPAAEWDAWGLYRAAFLHYRVGDDVGIRLWYTGFNYGDLRPNGDPAARIGYTEGALYAGPVSDTVAPVTNINLDNGAYAEGTEIILAAALDWNAVTIKYRWDGESWQDYTTPLVVQEGVLDWYGTDETNDEDYKSREFYIEVSPFKFLSGLPAGILLKLDGSPAGIIKHF